MVLGSGPSGATPVSCLLRGRVTFTDHTVFSGSMSHRPARAVCGFGKDGVCPLAEGFVYHGTVDPDRAIAAGQDASGPVNLFGRGGEDGQHGFDLAGMDAQLAAHPLIARSSCVARRFVRVIQRGGHPVERPGQISKT